jgi:hypothetical protein
MDSGRVASIGFNRIRSDRHSHGYSAATGRTGRYADVAKVLEQELADLIQLAQF